MIYTFFNLFEKIFPQSRTSLFLNTELELFKIISSKDALLKIMFGGYEYKDTHTHAHIHTCTHTHDHQYLSRLEHTHTVIRALPR